MPSGRRYWSRLVPHRYLVYKLLHLLHGVVSLQQRRHSHEAFVAAPVVLFLLLLVILFVYSSVIWDVLRRREKQTLLTTTGSRGPILHSGAFARYAARDGRRRENDSADTRPLQSGVGFFGFWFCEDELESSTAARWRQPAQTGRE